MRNVAFSILDPWDENVLSLRYVHGLFSIPPLLVLLLIV